MKTYATAIAVIVSALTLLMPLRASAASAPTSTYYPPRRPAPAPAPSYRYQPAPAPSYRYQPAPAPSYRRAPTYGGVYDAISQASARWGVSYGWLLRVATCESGLNPGAYNPSGASGLFQMMPGTYYSAAARIGEYRSIWDPYANANVAAWMFSVGRSYEWVCR